MIQFRIGPGESVLVAARRVARRQLEHAAADLAGLAPSDEAVHDARKRCKKARAVARLLRPAVGAPATSAGDRLREVGRSLSGARDADAVLAAFDRLLAGYEDLVSPSAFVAVRGALVERRAAAGAPEATAKALELLRAARAAVDTWPGGEAGFEALRPGIRGVFARGRAAFRALGPSPTPEALHAWRRRTKDAWYTARLLSSLWPPVLEPWAAEIGALAELQGEEHDLVVLRDGLWAEPERFGDARRVELLVDLIERRRAELLARALPLGRRVHAERPRALAERVGALWEAAEAG